jgi:AcrR family transcriptional regulator
MPPPNSELKSGQARRRGHEHAAPRAAILAAALDLGRTDGWDAVTMRRIADRSEYSTSSAYNHFNGREDILLALVQDGFAHLRGALVGALASAAADPIDAVRAAVRAYLDFALSDPALYQLMYGLGTISVTATHTFGEAQAVDDVLKAPFTRSGDARACEHAVQIWGATHGLLALLAVGRVEVDRTHLHVLLDDLVDNVLARALPAFSD